MTVRYSFIVFGYAKNLKILVYVISFLFFQTELSGIKWRKLVWSEGDRGGGGGGGTAGGGHGSVNGGTSRGPGSEELRAMSGGGHPVRMAEGLHAASRRHVRPGAAAARTAAPLSLAASKELWIFWYGEEPDLNELVSPELNMS
ncbi:hypothetical protein NQ317_005294, partial [Molorchus minor]